MVNVVIWGAGIYCKHVVSAIKKDKCNLLGIVDSRIHTSGIELFEGIYFGHLTEELGLPLYEVPTAEEQRKQQLEKISNKTNNE